jgi:redox-sensitive bicupin YhaK (pirin superfamily)
MTAGRGIAHSEDSAPGPGRLHLVQLWIALPDAQRQRAPAFCNYPQLPRLKREGFEIQVLAGSLCGERSPAEIHSPLVGADLSSAAAARTTLPLTAAFEHAALVLSGAARIAGEELTPGTLLYLGRARTGLTLSCEAPARILLIGGEPFGEHVLLWWNFVARHTGEIEEATRDWNAGRRFGAVHGSPSAPLVAPELAGLHLRPPRGPPGVT